MNISVLSTSSSETYVAPEIEEVISSDEIEQEVLYAGFATRPPLGSGFDISVG